MTPRQLQETLPQWMTVLEVAHRYRISRQQVYRQVAKGKLPPPRPQPATKYPRWSRAELDALDAAGIDERRHQI